MHPTQQDILESLRQGESRKFTELLSDVAETSDNLTYHLKQLQKSEFIESVVKGEYKLAPKGLIYLNNNLELNHDLFPTVSCMLELHDARDRILVMRKLKQPFLGSVHLPTFGVTSSDRVEAQIREFFDRYHITASGLVFHKLHRERVRSQDDLFVFDKFFVVFKGVLESFEESVDNRAFMAVPASELTRDPKWLNASKIVLSAGPGAGFTEDTYDQPQP